jgi:hypothetical protein
MNERVDKWSNFASCIKSPFLCLSIYLGDVLEVGEKLIKVKN